MTNDLYCSTDGCGDFENNVSKILVDISRLQNKDIDQDRRIDDIEAIGFNAAAQTALDGTVKKTGNESIAGIKTFTDNVEVGTTQVPKQLSIKGNLLIDGNITQNGSAYETHAQQVYTTDDKIIMRDGATAGLISGATSGLIFKKYDGTNDGELSVDSSGTARAGDVGDLQPLATRNEAGSMTNNQPVVWDSSSLKMVTRALVAGDIPDLDAGKIKTGTIADERIPSGITRDTELTAHTSRTDNPHSVTKAQVGLGNVDNTSDINIMNQVYPVGSIYTSVVDTNPNQLFGVGTWVRFGAGRVLAGVDTTQTEFNTVEKTGGASTHTLTVAQMPSHNHSGTTNKAGSSSGSVVLYTQDHTLANSKNSTASGIASLRTLSDSGNIAGLSTGSYSDRIAGFDLTIPSHEHTLTSNYVGSGSAHNNLPPYITVYMWKRTA